MIKVTVQNNKNQYFEANFSSENEATEWINIQVEKQSWGKPDRWISFIFEPDQGYTETREIEDKIEYFYPCEYQIEIKDTSLELQLKAESDEALKFLNETDYKILRHNGQLALGIATTMTHSQYLALEQQRQAARAKVIS